MKQWQSEKFEMLIEFMQCLGNQLIFLFVLEIFGKVVPCSGSMEKFQSMFVGSISIFERIDLDDISGFWYITDRFNLSVDDSIFE